MKLTNAQLGRQVKERRAKMNIAPYRLFATYTTDLTLAGGMEGIVASNAVRNDDSVIKGGSDDMKRVVYDRR